MNLESVVKYVESVPIVTAPALDSFESAPGNAPIPPVYNDENQAVVIGSQIAEFADGVPADVRPHVSNSLLLAQLAANKAIENDGSTAEWYSTYVEVLTKIGWLVEGDVTSRHEVSGTGAQVHRAIVPVLTAALGGATAATATLVVKLLEGLAQMSERTPWFTLFDRESKRAEANQFQICHLSSANGSAPTLVLICFGLDAAHSVTQVLFFKFSSAEATLSHSQANLSINVATFDGIKDKIHARVQSHLSDYISDIPI